MLGGTLAPTFDQVHRLTYVRQVLDEALRLWPTAPGFNRHAREDTVIGGALRAPGGHRDDRPVAGAAPRHVRLGRRTPRSSTPTTPRRSGWARSRPTRTSRSAPGSGPASGGSSPCRRPCWCSACCCSGSTSSTTSTTSCTPRRPSPSSPTSFCIQVRPRPGVQLDRTGPVAGRRRPSRAPQAVPALHVARHGTPLRVLFGSNLGTAEGIATRLAQEGTERGFDVTLGALDDHVERPAARRRRARGLLVLQRRARRTTPPRSADGSPKPAGRRRRRRLHASSAAATPSGRRPTRPCPTLLDDAARPRTAAAASTRAARATPPATSTPPTAPGTTPSGPTSPPRSACRPTSPTDGSDRPAAVDHGDQPAGDQPGDHVLPGAAGGSGPTASCSPHGQRQAAERSTRHVEVALPAGMAYQAGDHLGVLPRNNIDLIRRVMVRFGLDAGQYLTIVPNSGTHTHLPIDEPAPLLGILGSCVELQDVATRGDIETMAGYTDDPEQQAALRGARRRRRRVPGALPRAGPRANRSVLDLLEEFPACDAAVRGLPRHAAAAAPPLLLHLVLAPGRARTSAASPPACCAGPARSGTGKFTGVCSSHLAELPAEQHGLRVRAGADASRSGRRTNPHMPMIMIGAGTGLAPFRGFLQERAALQSQGVPVAALAAVLRLPRTASADYLYADELRGYEADGLVRVEDAFSRDRRRAAAATSRTRCSTAPTRSGTCCSTTPPSSCAATPPRWRPGVRSRAHRRSSATRRRRPRPTPQAWLAGLRTTDRFVEDIWGG